MSAAREAGALDTGALDTGLRGGASSGQPTGDTPARRRPVVWQPKQPVFWLAVVLLSVSLVATVIELIMLASSVQAAGAALLLIAVQALLFVVIARAMPRFARQPRSLRLTALLWGFAVVPALAGVANSSASTVYHALGLGSFDASLSAPINEDLLRLLGVLLVLALAQRRPITVMDGAVYGFIVGAGFELVENLIYSLRGDDFMATLSVGVTRLLVGFGLHALWTALAGAGLAYCLSRRQAGQSARWWLLVPTVGVPMLLHAGWDAPDFSIFSVLKLVLLVVLYALSVVALLVAVQWGRRSEFAWYVRQSGAQVSYADVKRLPRAERRRLAAEAVASERRS